MKPRGFTLVEMQVSLVLLLIILVVLFESVSFGLKAHRKGEAARQATAFAREAVSRIQSEMSTAVGLDTFAADPLNGIDTDFQSAVLYPDPYPPLSVPFTGAFYLRERPTLTLPGNRSQIVDRAHNRVIFSRPGKVADNNYNDRDYTQFLYVEYVVAEADSNGNGQNRLFRRLYQVANGPLSPPRGVNLGGYQRVVVPTFFALDATDPFTNPNTVVANLTSQQQADQSVVLELPHKDDQISFTVDHPQYVDSRGRSAPPAPAFDPSLFTVSVTVSLNRDGPAHFMATRTLSEQTRVKSGT